MSPSQPFTVLHLINGLGSGGAEAMLTRVATYDFGSGSPRQVVVSLIDSGMHGETLKAAGIELHCIGMRRGHPSLRGFASLVALMRATKPNLLMTWLYHADLLGTLAAPLAGIRRVVWNVRCSDLDFSRYARTTRWTVKLLTLLSWRPAAVAINSRAGQRVHERLGYKPRRWVYLPNGLDIGVWHPGEADRGVVRGELGIGPREIAVGLVARVDPQKDHAAFFAAAEGVLRDVPEARFVLIGHGTEGLRAPAPVHARTLLLGERRDVPRLLRGLDMTVLSSAFGEGFPNVVAEAMATALPCIVTDVGDSASVVGETGLVVPPRDPAALAGAISKIASLSEGERRHLGEAARARAAEHFTLDAVASRYRALWEETSVEI